MRADVPKRGEKTLPPDVQREFEKATETIHRVLWKLTDGALDHEALPELDRFLNPALDAAKEAGKAARAARDVYAERTVSLQTVVASNVRALRQDKTLTQDELAAEMRDRGFNWKRITVAEIEAAAEEGATGRKVSNEELFALADLFDRPMALLLVPRQGDRVWIGDDAAKRRLVDWEEAQRGIIGLGTLRWKGRA